LNKLRLTSGIKYFTSGDGRVEVKISHAKKKARAVLKKPSYYDCPLAHFKIGVPLIALQDESQPKTQNQSALD